MTTPNSTSPKELPLRARRNRSHALGAAIPSLWFLLLCLCQSSSFAQASQLMDSKDICHLCGDEGVDGITFPYAIVESDGTTCSTKALDMASQHMPGSQGCILQQAQFRSKCCGSNKPADVQVVLPEPDEVKHIGPYPQCGICPDWKRNGNRPTETSMVLTVLYLGSGSCAQFEKAGMEGMIPTHLCDPIQFFSEEPCGCGEFARKDGQSPYSSIPHETVQTNRNPTLPEPEEENPVPQDQQDEGMRTQRVPDSRDQRYSIAGQRGGAGAGGSMRRLRRNQEGSSMQGQVKVQ